MTLVADQIEMITHDTMYGGDVLAVTECMAGLHNFIRMDDEGAVPAIDKGVMEKVHQVIFHSM